MKFRVRLRFYVWDLVEAFGGLLVIGAAFTQSLTLGLLVAGVVLIIAANVGGTSNDDRQ